MSFLKADTKKDLFIHLAIILAIGVIIVVGFFYIYLPITTNHNETVSVPKLNGMHLDQLEEFLGQQHLRYQINDSTYVPGAKPHTVISQHPAEGTKVKENRKIYISISSLQPPKVKMPNLVDASLKSAEMMLRGNDLVKGNVRFVSSPYANLVLQQLIGNTPVKAGTYIPKGTKINLVVGDGEGKAEDDDTLSDTLR